MGKSTEKPRAKRKLIDELNKEHPQTSNNDKRRRYENSTSENPLPSTSGSRSKGMISKNNDIIVRIVANNDKRRVSQYNSNVCANLEAKQRKEFSSKFPKVKSKVVLPGSSKQTRSRVIRKPVRYLEQDTEINGKPRYEKPRSEAPIRGVLKDNRGVIGNKGMSKIDRQKIIDEKHLSELNKLDTHTEFEISEGNAAVGANLIDHDGIELSVNGSDLEEFISDDETETQYGTVSESNQDHLQQEPGEIFSDEEDTVTVTLPKEKSKDKRIPKLASNGKFSKFQHLKDDPEFNDFLDSMLDRKLSGKVTETSKVNSQNQKGKKGNDDLDIEQPNQSSKRLSNNVVNRTHQIIKSPSDTTLYSPGLRKANNYANGETNAIEKISTFVDNMRITQHSGDARSTSRNRSAEERFPNNNLQDTRRSTTATYDRDSGSSKQPASVDSEKTTDQLLVQAEKFKARVEAPEGRSNLIMPYDYEELRSKFITEEGLGPIDNEILFLRIFDQDDEFFHVTSQIDPGLKSKIERGEFIDLERLLPKDKFSSNIRGNDDLNKQLFQLISQGTNSYVTPPEAKGNNRINSVKKWDQAFRVYAAIYTQANPIRSSEIWQYVYVIHTAAAANSWDSVAFYDITFRELMACKPWRSWGKTYTQGWNMAFNSGANYGTQNYGQGTSGTSRNSGNNNVQDGGQHSWKDDCCWRFNKNRCKRTAAECRYDHRCTHCAGWYHSYNDCRKRSGNKNGGRKSNNWGSFNKSSRSPSTNKSNGAKKPTS